MARTAKNVGKQAAKKVNDVSKSPEAREVESRLIKLAEQVGWFAGTVQYKADTLMSNEALKQQLTQIRDGASAVLERVNRAGSGASESVAKATKAAKSVLPKSKAELARMAKQAEADEKRERSRAAVAAPGKKHRKPPPQTNVARHATERVAQPVIQRPMPNQQRRGVR